VGLLYGEGDIRKTMEIATRCGQDADCNPSSAAGVLGCMKGFDALDEDLVSGIPAIENTNFAFTHYSFKTLIPACQRMAEKIIRRAGGTITEDGYLIPRQSPKAPDKLEQWENQMDLLKNAIPPFAMQLWDPAWKLVQCGASNPGPGLYGEHRGRRDVLLLRAVDETEPAIIQADLTVPAGSHPKMVIPAAAWDRQEDVVLKVFINDNVALEKLIADEGKWVTASVDLTGHEGKRINARVEIHPKGRRLEAAYLDQIEIK